MIYVVYCYIFILGASFGSFLNVLASRLPKGISILGRSKCSNCHHTLGFLDLVPIFSFIFLRGKCRYCKTKISYLHPLFEVVCGSILLAFIIKLNFVFSLSNILTLILVLIMLLIALTDYYYQIILDEYLVLVFIIGLLLNFTRLSQVLPSAFFAGFLFWLVYFWSKGTAMGYADIKYVFVVGFVLTFTSLFLGIYLAFLTGGIVSAILILMRQKKIKSTIAFGPFLSVGFLIALWQLI